jgi:hypothetical protein
MAYFALIVKGGVPLFRVLAPNKYMEFVSGYASLMAMLNRDFGIRHVFFYDDLFTFDRERVAKFCDLKAKKGLKVTYNCVARLKHSANRGNSTRRGSL